METSVVFVSIFLSLVAGRQQVEVAVEGPVASVEIILDGRLLGTMQGDPWQLACDLGAELAPHELVAVARDENGDEVARDRQLLNLPRGSIECQLLLHRNQQGIPSAVRLVWQSIEELQAQLIQVTLDGEPLTDGDPTAAEGIQLPQFDPASSHFISAEVELSQGEVCRAETMIGISANEVRTDLTAVPIALEHGAAEPTFESVQGMFRVAGEAVEVAAIDSGGAGLYVIRDNAAMASLVRLELDEAGRSAARRGKSVREYMDLTSLQLSRSSQRTSGDRVVLLDASAKESGKPGLPDIIFPSSTSFNFTTRGLPWLITHIRFAQASLNEQRLSDAVAAAGVRAAATQARRAVLLVVDTSTEDASQYNVETIRSYLQRIQVPLVVWRTGKPKNLASGWKDGERIRTYNAIPKSAEKLVSMLRSQRIVWLAGQHLPHQISLSDKARGFHIAR